MHSPTCVSVVVCVARKPRPCLSYSRRRDRINLVLLRSYYKGGGGVLIWDREGPQRAKGYFKDNEVGADMIVLLIVLCCGKGRCINDFCGQSVCSP